MNHLTDDQISALLDGALPERERAASDAHLAGCDACRARLAEASALEASLGKALTHDPGEAYFAGFAARVSARIAGSPAPGTPESVTPARARPGGLWAWLVSPRGLSLVGSAAAVVVTAGLAWMRFQSHDDAASALRAERPTPVGVNAPPLPAESRPEFPAESAAANAVRGETAGLANGAAAPRGTTVPPAADALAPGAADARRAREVRTLANGEPVPVRSQAQAPPKAALQSSEPVSPIPAMKRRAAGPANETPAPAAPQAEAPAVARSTAEPGSAGTGFANTPGPAAAKKSGDLLGKVRSLFREQKPAAPPPPPTASQGFSETPELSRPPEATPGPAVTRELAGTRGDAAAREREQAVCGTVRDLAGHPVAWATVSVVGERTLTLRTGADGAFCLDGAHAGDTLSVFRVGYASYRMALTPTSSLAIALEPMPALGARGGLALGTPNAPRASGTLGYPGAEAPEPDVYAALAPEVRAAVAQARDAQALAAREHTVAGYERAVARWDVVAARTHGAAGYDARFRSLAALREAYRLEPSLGRTSRYRAALAAFVAATPRTLPERATVLRWQGELGGGPAYR